MPAAIVTILPACAMRLATVDDALSVQPSAPPSESVRTSMPSLYPFRSASTMMSSGTPPVQPKMRYE